MNSVPATLVSVLRTRALRTPDRLAFEFVLDDGEYLALDYAELDIRARAVAALLLDAGGAGRPVLLAHQPGPDYLTAFFGCLYAKAVAVPVYPPTGPRGLERVRA